MKDTTKNLYFERMHLVLRHIQANLDEDLTLESLAAMTFFSPIHFHRIFKGMFGETVIEHIRRIRMERAATRLAMGTSSVTVAAFDAGYETVESFSRAFKKMFDCPPSKYQENHWKNLYKRLSGSVHYLPENARIRLTITQQKEVSMKVKIERIAPLRVAYVRHVGPYKDCTQAWETLCAWAEPKGLFDPLPKFIGICYDDPQVTPADKIRYDACFTVHADVEGAGEIGIQTLSGGDYAVTRHCGPYSELEQAYGKLMGQWLPTSGQELKEGPSFEIYLNAPDNTPPEELQTDIYLPLK
ncbi:AraC family transcriptional regulator [Pseudodesulfovibrio sp. JC047]|uniref:AraC family transcriptional regulator n=1 Tax=Pseudodesulfovibrio sp. JC047 TaxID=2683199 RepID=UPI0013D484FA|nr:AraC family transcriptional regulator [Pseudodesulfovibrio sp. JC047]